MAARALEHLGHGLYRMPMVPATSLDALYGRQICSWTAPCLTPPLSPHVISALAYLDSALQDRPRLQEAARAAGISPSRLTHLFSRQVGIPFRRFVLWLRLRRAAEHVSAGSSLTEAAIAAGFSDQPHLTRICTSICDVTPSAICRAPVPEPKGGFRNSRKPLGDLPAASRLDLVFAGRHAGNVMPTRTSHTSSQIGSS